MGVVLYKQRGWKFSNSIVLFFDLSKRVKDSGSPLYVERGTIFSFLVHWFPFQARRLFVFLIKSGGWWRVLDRAKRVSWNRQIPL